MKNLGLILSADGTLVLVADDPQPCGTLSAHDVIASSHSEDGQSVKADRAVVLGALAVQPLPFVRGHLGGLAIGRGTFPSATATASSPTGGGPASVHGLRQQRCDAEKNERLELKW